MRVILIALLVGCGMLIGNESSAQTTQRPSQTFIISKHGTLLELTDADGTGPGKKASGDGFKLNYKTRGKTRSASAMEMKTNRLRTSSESSKYDGNKATAVVRTTDRSLEITSELTFDAKAGELIIKRKFRNISRYPVTLKRIWNYIDPKIVVRGQYNQSADLVAASLGQITAGLADDANDCDMGACEAPPVCPVCPPIQIRNRILIPGISYRACAPQRRWSSFIGRSQSHCSPNCPIPNSPEARCPLLFEY